MAGLFGARADEQIRFIHAAGFLCKLETGCDFLRFFRPNRCRNPPYIVLFARKQTDTEGEYTEKRT